MNYGVTPNDRRNGNPAIRLGKKDAAEVTVDLIEERQFNCKFKRMFRHVKRIHFIGIGGIGMSGIAEVLCISVFPFRVQI